MTFQTNLCHTYLITLKENIMKILMVVYDNDSYLARFSHPVDILKPQVADIANPQPKACDHQKDYIIPLPFGSLTVNDRQKLFHIFLFPEMGIVPFHGILILGRDSEIS